MKKYIRFFVGLLLVSGCSHAGPFVTNISSNGAGELIIEKCMVEFNGLLFIVNNSDCQNISLKIK